MRLCIDYLKLNAVTKTDAHPLPRIEDIFDTLTSSKFFCTLDLAMCYHQVEVHPEDREKTAFSTPFGLFQYNVMPFGLATAPATFLIFVCNSRVCHRRNQHSLPAHSSRRRTRECASRNCPSRGSARDTRARSRKSSRWSLRSSEDRRQT